MRVTRGTDGRDACAVCKRRDRTDRRVHALVSPFGFHFASPLAAPGFALDVWRRGLERPNRIAPIASPYMMSWVTAVALGARPDCDDHTIAPTVFRMSSVIAEGRLRFQTPYARATTRMPSQIAHFETS